MTTTGFTGQSITLDADCAREVKTFSEVRLGDNLAHLHFLRALAKRHPHITFTHAAHHCYLSQMIEVVCDLPNIRLVGLKWAGVDSTWINSWKNTDKFWETHELRNDYAAFMLDWFRLLAGRMGFESPFTLPSDLLFDYPALGVECSRQRGNALVVNSAPMSGQFRAFSPYRLSQIAGELSARGYSVFATAPVSDCALTSLHNWSVTDIGIYSRTCELVLMVSTGPSWPTFNVWNRTDLRTRIALISDERLTLDPNCLHAANDEEARYHLKATGYL